MRKKNRKAKPKKVKAAEAVLKVLDIRFPLLPGVLYVKVWDLYKMLKKEIKRRNARRKKNNSSCGRNDEDAVK